jgi:hypothetical protein
MNVFGNKFRLTRVLMTGGKECLKAEQGDTSKSGCHREWNLPGTL